jgi:hypothetical protein
MQVETENAQLKASGLRLKPLDHDNNDLSLISLSAVKFLVIDTGEIEGPYEADPREAGTARRLVLRFDDTERNVMRTYLDQDFIQDGDGIKCKVYNPESKMMEHVVVPMLALKGVFTVKEWDSRKPGAAREIPSGERALWARW